MTPLLDDTIAALRKIAVSYPWEPYESDETVIESGVVGGRVIHAEHPTNRRVAIEALTALGIPICPACFDEGHVCENHPGMPWTGGAPHPGEPDECHGAGMPCPACCSPVPRDGTRSAAEAFTPDWKRGTR